MLLAYYMQKKSDPYPSSNKLVNALRKTTEQTSRTKDGIRKQQTRLPSKDITQLAIERLKRGQSQEIRGRNPARQVQCFQIRADLAITGYNDCLVGCC